MPAPHERIGEKINNRVVSPYSAFDGRTIGVVDSFDDLQSPSEVADRLGETRTGFLIEREHRDFGREDG